MKIFILTFHFCKITNSHLILRHIHPYPMRKVLFSIGILVAFSSCNYVNDVFLSLEKQIQTKVSSFQSILPDFDNNVQLDNNKLIQLNIPKSVDTSSSKSNNFDMLTQFLSEKIGL
jgi:hypothetical protein